MVNILSCVYADVKRDRARNSSCDNTNSSVTAVSNCYSISTVTSKETYMTLIFFFAVVVVLPIYFLFFLLF